MEKSSLLLLSSFKENFITAINTYPIVYIKNYDYSLIEQFLGLLVENNQAHNPLELSKDDIAVCDFQINKLVRINSRTSFPEQTEIEFVPMLKKICARKTYPYNKNIYIITDANTVWNEAPFIHYMHRIALKHEQGQYDDFMCVLLLDSRPVSEMPSSLEKYIGVLEIPHPTLDEIEYFVENVPVSRRYIGKEKSLREELARTLLGLDYYEIESIFKSIIHQYGAITKSSLSLALECKKNIVKKSGLIEVCDTDVQIRSIGGLKSLIDEIVKKSYIYKNLRLVGSKRLNLPFPKGFLIIGMPGCGKSLIAKAISNSFETSLIRLDVNKLMGKYVGESEENLRNALKLAETAQPCVLWIDEVEKAFAGSNGHSNDMLIQRLMGQFLTWMQERTSAVFVVATANDVLKPEFMRKGRFDEVFFVDFPSQSETESIIQKKLERYENKDSIFDTSEIRKNIHKIALELNLGDIEIGDNTFRRSFSGSEIESLINSVVENSFIEYIINKERSSDSKFSQIQLSSDKVISMANQMKRSIMAAQEDRSGLAKTSIEKIRDMQNMYNFRNASE